MTLNILHLHASFDAGGAEARSVRLINAWGRRARHMIVSADPARMGAGDGIDAGIAWQRAQNPPPLAGRPSVARYEAIARTMRGADLVLTHGWGAIDGVMARRVFGKGAPPLIHHEDGFGVEEAAGLKRERNIYRRVALSAAHALVVPSTVLERIALETWKQPPARVRRIPLGIATHAYDRQPDATALKLAPRRPGEVIVGAIGPLTDVKDLAALVRAVAGVSGRVRLVIVGDGPERQRIEAAAMMMGMGDQLVLAGAVDRPWRWLRAFDLLALSSKSEQYPTAVLMAMAAGLPVAAPELGDIPAMVAEANRPFIAVRHNEVRLRDAIQALVADPALRAAVGAANRIKALAEHDEATMIERYARLYEEALGRPGALL